MKIKKLNQINKKVSTFLFCLRNKNYVRKNSLKSSKISIREHNVWIKNFSKKKNTLFIVTKEGIPIGYVRLELDKKIYNTSWALLKKYHGKGYAKKSLNFATRSRIYKFKALIKKNNVASIKIALNSRFKPKATKKNIIYMYKN